MTDQSSSTAPVLGIMSSAKDHGPRAAEFRGANPDKCLVCGDPIGEHCFCKIHRKEGGPIMFCCPDCAMQYLDSARVPADPREQELLACEKSVHFFIGEDKPWR